MRGEEHKYIMGLAKRNKVRRRRAKNKDGTFTKTGFVTRLVEAGWELKEAVREYKRIKEGAYDNC